MAKQTCIKRQKITAALIFAQLCCIIEIAIRYEKPTQFGLQLQIRVRKVYTLH